jgi:hypothetical protein
LVYHEITKEEHLMKKLNLTSGKLPNVFYSGGSLFISRNLLRKLDSPINPYGVTPAFFVLGEGLSPIWGENYSSDYRRMHVSSDFDLRGDGEPLKALLKDMHDLQKSVGLEDPKDSFSIEAWVHD